MAKRILSWVLTCALLLTCISGITLFVSAEPEIKTVTLPDPGWNSAGWSKAEFQGLTCMKFQGGDAAFSWNNKGVANAMGRSDELADLQISVTAYRDGNGGGWLQLNTMDENGETAPSLDGSNPHDNGFGTMDAYGLKAGEWSTITVNRERQKFGVDGTDNMYLKFCLDEGVTVYVKNIEYVATFEDGSVITGIWAAAEVADPSIKKVGFGDRINCTDYTELARPVDGQRLENGDTNIGWNNQGDYIDFTVNVIEAGVYDIAASMANGNGDCTVELKDAEADTVYGSVVVPQTNWGDYQLYIFDDVELQTGVQTLRIYFAQSSCNFQYMDLMKPVKKVGFGDRINCSDYTGLARPEGDNYQRIEDSGVDIGFNNQGDFIDFKVNVTDAGIYNITAALGTGNPDATVELRDADSGKVYGSVVVPQTGWGPDAHQDYVFEGVKLEAGIQTLRIYFAQSSSNFWYMDLADSGIKEVGYGSRIDCKDYTELARPEGENYQQLENGDVDIGFNSQGDFINFKVFVNTAGLYNIVAALGTGNPAATVELRDGEGNVYGSVVVPTTGWGGDMHQDYVFEGVELKEGLQILQIYYAQSSANFWYMDLQDARYVLTNASWDEAASNGSVVEFEDSYVFQFNQGGGNWIGIGDPNGILSNSTSVTYEYEIYFNTENGNDRCFLAFGDVNGVHDVSEGGPQFDTDGHWTTGTGYAAGGHWGPTPARFTWGKITLTNNQYDPSKTIAGCVTRLGGWMDTGTLLLKSIKVYDNDDPSKFIELKFNALPAEPLPPEPAAIDVVVTDILFQLADGTFTDAPAVGEKVRLAFVVKNVGTETLPEGTKYGGIVKMGDALLGWSDNYKSVDTAPALAPGETITLITCGGGANNDGTWDVPTPAGEFELFAQVNDNPGDGIADEDTSNNTFTKTFKSHETDEYDVIVTDLQIVGTDREPTALVAGGKVVFKITVKNNGSTAIPAGSKYGFIVKLGDKNGEFLVWGDEMKSGDSPELKPGETMDLYSCGGGTNSDGSWTVPEGEFELTAQVNDNPGDGIKEYNTENNFFSADFTAHAADEYDVIVTDLQIVGADRQPADVAVGSTVFFKITVKNNGDTAIPAGAKYGFIVKLGDKNGEFLVWGDEMKAGNSPELKPGETMDLYSCGGGANSNGSWTVPEGEFELTAQVNDNPGDGIKEYNTENNFFTASFIGHAADEYDVIVADLELVNGEGEVVLPTAGMNVRFQITVKNNGGNAIPAGEKYGAIVKLGDKLLAWGDEYKAGNSPELKPGETLTFITNGGDGGGWWTVPEEDFELTAQVNDNPGDGIKEYDLTNNTLTKQFTLGGAFPDDSALRAAIEEVEAMDLSGYTEESAQALLDAVAAAKKLDQEAPTQEQMDAALKAINDAKAALVEKPVSTAKLGDADGDGEISSTDARLALQLAVGKIKAENIANADLDVDGDGDITSTDARLLLQLAVNKITEADLPVNQQA